MKCDEYVGAASGTGHRRSCSRTARWIARKDGQERTYTLCTPHARAWERAGWTISNVT